MKRHIILVTALLAALAATSSAQEKKPGGLNKVARDVSKTSKEAGREAKSGIKKTSSEAHHGLTKAGNNTKAELKRTTGLTTPAPSPGHKPGGLNKMARDVSHESKKTGAHLKHQTKKESAKGHGAATKAGKKAKEEVKNP
jgi:flagellar motor protein MotB